MAKKADTLTDAIYRKADHQLKKDVDALYATITEFIIKHGAGSKVAFGGVNLDGAHTPALIGVHITRGASSTTEEVYAADVIKKFPEILMKICEESFRNQQVREFIDAVDKVNELEAWAEDADGYINRG